MRRDRAQGRLRASPAGRILPAAGLLALAILLLGISPAPPGDNSFLQAAGAREEYARIYLLYQDIREETDRDHYYRKALESFRSHLQKHPAGETAGPARFQIAECHWYLREGEEAAKLWETVTKGPDERLAARSHIRLGDHLHARKEFREALAHYRQGASPLAGKDEELRCRLQIGICLYLLGEREEATRLLTLLSEKAGPGILQSTAKEYLRRLAEESMVGGAKERISKFQEDYSEFRRTRDKDRKQLLEEVIRDNLEGWDRIDHPEILSGLRAIVVAKKHPFGPEAVREVVQIGPPKEMALLATMLQDRNEPLRLPILRSLVEEEVFIQDSVVEAIFLDRTVGPRGLRIAAADYIASRDSAEAIAKLYGEITISREGLREPSNRALNDGIRKALIRMESVESGKALRRIARDRSQHHIWRLYAVEALGNMTHPGIQGDLIPILKEKRVDLISRAAEALGRSGGPEAAGALRRMLRKRPKHTGLLIALLRGLAGAGVSEEDDAHLLPLAGSSQMEVRILAHSLLRRSGGKAARARMLTALGDKVWQVRWHAIRAVGQGAPSAESVSALLGRLPREVGRLKYQVLKYLRRVTGVSLGPDSKDWKRWWEGARDDYDPASVKLAPLALGPESGKTVTRKDLEGAEESPRYFGIEVLSRNAIFILDTSGSMVAAITIPPKGGESTRPRKEMKLKIAKQELTKVLLTFKKRTAFNILWFQSGYTSLWGRIRPATPESVSRAIRTVKGLSARDLTNIYDPLAEAFRDPEVDTIYLLSDGEANRGSFTRPEDILREIRALNSVRMITIHTIYLGGTSAFMEQLALQNGGSYIPVAR